MAENPGFPGEGFDFGYQEAGAALGGLVVRDASGNVRPGVMPSKANLITGRSDWNVDVAPFVPVRGDGPRVLLGSVDAPLQVAIAPAPASNSRIDLVWALARNVGAGDLAGCVHVVTGVPGLVPVKPALPAGGVELGTVTVPATATGTSSCTIVNTFRVTAAAGGVVGFRDQADQDGFTPTPYQLAYRVDTKQLLVYLPDAAVPGWFQAGGRPLSTALTYVGIYSAGSPAPQIVDQGGRVHLSGLVTSSSANFLAGTTYTIGSVPSGKAPVDTKRFACMSNVTAVAQVTVAPTGVITIVLNTSFTGALTLSLDGCSWPDKNL